MSDSENEMLIMALMDRPCNHLSSSDSTSSLDSLFADSDESGPRRKRTRIENYIEETVKEYDNNEFKSNFHVS
ncbi:hypothetical protein JTB14_019990 [Gonioctena quinquepunctata]|nr:hypothetical protein JTB14_019990 [Gonioctena quinquepunctata]